MIQEFFCKLDAGDSDLDIKVLVVDPQDGYTQYYCSKQGDNMFFTVTLQGVTVPVKPEAGGVSETVARFMTNYPNPRDMTALTYILQAKFCPLANNRVIPG